MKKEKLCPAMVRLSEAKYYELRRLALDRRSSFTQIAREVLEKYADEMRSEKPERRMEAR